MKESRRKVKSMSASKMRSVPATSDLDSFKKRTVNVDADKLMKQVRKGMS